MNPTTASPSFVSLPSNFTIHKQNITVKYSAQPTLEGPIVYRFQHRPAAAIAVPDRWGHPITPYDNTVLDVSASVKAMPEAVILYPGEQADVQVGLMQQAAGLVCAASVVPALVELLCSTIQSSSAMPHW